MPKTNCTHRLFFLAFSIVMMIGYNATAQSADPTVKAKHEKLKKDLKKIEGFFSLKKLFKHHDTVKLAKQFTHEEHQLLKQKEKHPFSTTPEQLNLIQKKIEPGSSFKLKKEVLGWYPHWEADSYKYLNYSLLSTIAYFSYEVDPSSGEAKTMYDWKTTPVVDSAQKYGIKMLLTVTNFGGSNNKKLLRSTSSTTTLINNIIQAIDGRGQGVCLDFEGVQEAQKEDYADFVSRLKTALLKANKDYQLYMAVPKYDWYKSMDFAKLIPEVDMFTIMGYPYYSSGSSVAGPVSPLNSGKLWRDYTLTNSVKYYLANSVPAQKLMLALPFYGQIWETKTDQLGSETKSFVGSRTYSYIKAKIPQPVKIEPESKSAYSIYSTDDGKYRQCWFENDTSFKYKLNFIKQEDLAGLGIWALGFDAGYDDLWKVIALEFATDSASKDTASLAQADSTKNDSINKSGGIMSKLTLANLQTQLQNVTNYRNVLLFIMVLVVFFAGIGLIIAMFEPDTRAFFFTSGSYKFYYIALVLLFLVVALRLANVIDNKAILLIVGFTIGAAGFYVVNRIIERKKRNRP